MDGRTMSTETFAEGIPPEVAPVRPGEELDWARLADYLRPLLEVDGTSERAAVPQRLGQPDLPPHVRRGRR